MRAKNLVKLFALLTFLFGLGILIMVFINVVTTGGDNPTTYTGSDIIFGAKKTYTLNGGFFTIYDASLSIDFSFILLLAFFLPMVLSIILFIVEFTSNSHFVKLIVGILTLAGFVVSLIFIILLRDFATATISSDNDTIKTAITALFGQCPYTFKFIKDYQFAIGAILGIVFAGCGIVSTAIYSVLNILKPGK